MNVKLKSLRTKAGKETRLKLQRLSILATEFLEKTLTYESLVSDYAETERLKRILLDNLWQGTINPHDPNLNPETPDDSAKMILQLHGLLTKGFWNRFKTMLQQSQPMKGPIVAPPGYESLTAGGSYTIETSIKFTIPVKKMSVDCCLDGETIHFYRSSIDAIPALLNLLQGLPFDNLRFCGNTDCNRLIVQRTNHEQKYCPGGKCQSMHYQRELRTKDPEKYKAYQREYYRLIKKREKRQADINAKGGGKAKIPKAKDK